MLSKFIPDYHTKSIYTIDYDKFYNEGIRLILLDLDNTLITYDETMPNDKLKALKLELENKGFELILVSNSKKNRVTNFAKALDIKCITFAKKPFKKGFQKALELASKKYMKDEVLEIGDQLMTDVFGSNRMHFTSLLVDPIDITTDKFFTKVNRFLEWLVKLILKLFSKKKYKEAILKYKGEKSDC